MKDSTDRAYCDHLARRALAATILETDADETLTNEEKTARVAGVLRAWLDGYARGWETGA